MRIGRSFTINQISCKRRSIMNRYHLNKQGETPENMGRKLAALVIGE